MIIRSDKSKRLITVGVWAASLFLVTGCSSGKQSTTTPSTTTVQTSTNGSSHSLADLGIDNVGQVRGMELPSLTVALGNADMQQVEVVVDRPPVDASCLTSATLKMYLTSATGADKAEVAVFASQQIRAQELHNGDLVGGVTIQSNRPRGISTIGATAGWVEWDVKDIVRRWMQGMPMDNAGITPPKAGPLVFTLVSPSLIGDSFVRTFSSVEGSVEQRPHMDWVAESPCP